MKVHPFDLWSSHPAEHEHELARLLLSGQHAEASDAACAMAEAPLNPELAQLMLLAHSWAGLPSRVESLVRTLEHPLRTEVRICLAYCYNILGRFELALETLSESDQSQYAMPAYWEVYGLVSIRLGQWDECDRALERLELFGVLGDPGRLNVSCWWYDAAEKYEEFLSFADEYLQYRPCDLMIETERSYFSVTKLGHNASTLESLVDKYPHYEYAWYRLACFRLLHGSIDDALVAARRATETGPYQFQSWQLLARLAYSKKRWKEASMAAEQAVNLAGKYGLKYVDLVEHFKCQTTGFRSLMRQFRIASAFKYTLNSYKVEYSQVGNQGNKDFIEYRRSLRRLRKAQRAQKPMPQK